jgi:NitT/TauT family transport system ATP-binding protein
LSGLPAIRFRQVTQRFGERYLALQDVSLEVPAESFVAVVGPSGCGKTTLLNLAAGLLQPTAGTVEVFGEPLAGLNRRAGYMFQQDALLPWKTVAENAGLALQFRGVPAGQARERALSWVRRVGLADFAGAYPSQLSGGMKKRAAMAQCWIADPDVLLMDEPFSALDVHTRLRMETVMLDLWTASPKTVLFVTHDLEEALALADQVVVLASGPASRVVGRFRVDLPRPRDLIDIRTQARFGELYGEIWRLLRQEVLRSYERAS